MAFNKPDIALSDIHEPTQVKMRMVVASADDQRSDVSDREAAVITLNVGQEYETTDHEGNTVVSRELLASATKTGTLILESDGGKVLVPAWMFEVAYEVGPLVGGEVLESDLPTSVARAAEAHTRGHLVFTERFLKQGDPVELTATLVPADGDDVACRVEGKAKLRDLTLDEMDLGAELNAAVHGKSSPTLVYGGIGFLVLLFVFMAISLRC